MTRKSTIADFCARWHVPTILNWVAFLATLSVLVLVIHGKEWRLLMPSLVATIPWIKAIFLPSLERKIKELTVENERLRPLKNNPEKTFGVWLVQLLDMMSLDNTWRASFYIYDERNLGKSLFRFMARKSNDPKLEDRGRSEFSAEEGVIGQSWHQGSFASYYATSKAIESRNQYNGEMLKIFNMNYEIAGRLTMMSACILSHVVCDGEGNKKGVLVIETTKYIKQCLRQPLEAKFKEVVVKVSKYLAKLAAITADHILCQEELLEGEQ